MILKIERPKGLVTKRDHIKLESVTIDGEQVPIEELIFKDDEVEEER